MKRTCRDARDSSHCRSTDVKERPLTAGDERIDNHPAGGNGFITHARIALPHFDMYSAPKSASDFSALDARGEHAAASGAPPTVRLSVPAVGARRPFDQFGDALPPR